MIVKVSGRDIGFIADSRFKSWGKVVRSSSDIDLTKNNGFALTSPFLNWGSVEVMQPGQYVVLAAEVGTWAHHNYEYALCRVTENGLERVPDEDLSAVKDNQEIPEQYRAKAIASTLYAYALYCAYALQQVPELNAEEAALVERLSALSPERLQVVLAAVK